MNLDKYTKEDLYINICNLRDALEFCIADLEYEESDGWMSGQMHSTDYKVAKHILELTKEFKPE